MTAVSIILLILLLFFWFTFRKSKIAYDKATKAMGISIFSNDEVLRANSKIIVALENSDKAKADIIKSLEDSYEELAKKYIKLRVSQLEGTNPDGYSGGNLYYKIQDLTEQYKQNKLNKTVYYLMVVSEIDN